MSIEGVKNVYPCNGAQTAFAITFPFASATDVTAFVSNTVTGERRRLVRNLDYTIRGSALILRNDEFREPWSADWNLCIQSRVRIEQGSSQAMMPSTFARRVDQLTQMLRQIREQTMRTLHIGVNYPPMNLTSAPYAHIAFDAVAVVARSVENSLNLNIDYVGNGQRSVVSGTMVTSLVFYDAYEREVIELAARSVVSGTMIAPLVLYDAYTREVVENFTRSVVSGTMTT